MEEILTHTGVSTMTAYRDVNALEQAGLVRRDQGMVSAVVGGLDEASVTFRLDQNPREKQRLAQRAAERISTGSSLILDDSTSGVYVLRALPQTVTLTVITNSLLVARETHPMPNVRLFMTGGEYRGWADALMGPTTLRTIGALDADFCVISASGLKGGWCSHPYEDVAAVKRAMVDSARFKILIVDHTKLRRRALHTFAHISDFDLVLTDSHATAEQQAALAELAKAVEVVDVAEEGGS